MAAMPDLETAYRQRFSSSAALYERAQETFVDGITHDTRKVLPFPVYVARAEGSRKWDVDGNELVDWVSGHGALLLGHNHPTVTAAAQRQLVLGTHYGAGHEAEIRWGEMVRRLVPSAEVVRFTSSGTEATLLAIRIARAATGKTQVLKFNGHFHGWHDYTIRGRGAASDQIAGVPDQVDATVALLPPDLASVTSYLADRRDVAAIIVEPSGAGWGTAPLVAGFLEDLRRITEQEGIVLIFDEVVTGFRWAPGGVQELIQVLPDLTALAKILAGGLPGGAVAGRRDLMETLSFARATEEPSRKIPHYGTFNANPLSAAAGAACLELVADGQPQLAADSIAREVRERLNETLQVMELPGFVYGASSVFHIVVGRGSPGDAESADSGGMDDGMLLSAPYRPVSLAIQQAMMLEGVHLFNMGGIASSVHTEADVEQTVGAFKKGLEAVEPPGQLVGLFASRRSTVHARRGMVATSQPLAAMAGLRILMAGGNAADAAVATAAALNVTEPTSTGIGGDCFALFYAGSSGEISALNGSGRAPAALSLDLLKKEGLNGELPGAHAHTITVPGACAGWCDLLERHGTMPIGEALAPAIELAEEGFPVAPLTARGWQLGAKHQLVNSTGGRELTIDGRAPNAGEIIRLPTLAHTLRTVADGGKDAFYRGEIARRIAETVQRHGGVMTVDDLAEHRSTWDEPISTTYRGVRIWECPPNGQGLAALIALNLLEGFELRGQDPQGVERLHLMTEAMRVAFADTAWYVADPAFNDLPVEALLAKDYAAQRRALIDRRRATVDVSRGAPTGGSDTVYLTVVDGDGNACSFINSLYVGFGTGIVPEGTGISLQNRGQGFSLDRRHPNALAPGKRPYHTIIPALATNEDGSLYASFGVMGGYMQPQGHVQVVVAMVDDDADPQAALDRPRFCLSAARPDSRVELEEGIDASVVESLAAMGHDVSLVRGWTRSAFGRGQIIRRDPATGTLFGGSDPRADGAAVGW